MNKKPIMYLQGDSKWGSIKYSSRGDASQTIKSSGCGTTSASMILATWINKNITPKETSADALANGYRTANDGTDWSYFSHVAKKYNLKFKQTGNINEMLEAVKNGAYAVLSMKPPTFTKYGHFILAWNNDGKVVSVNDPASTERSNKTWSLDVFRKECGQCFIFYPPTAIEVAKTVGTKVNYCKAWQTFYNKTTATKAPIATDGIYGKNTQLSLDTLLGYMKQGKKYKYCLEFEIWYNNTTQTSKPLTCNGVWDTETQTAFAKINELVKAQ